MMLKSSHLRPCLFVSLVAAISAGAATFTVPSANHTTIQDAVNAATPGDTIIVLPGSYTSVEIPVGKDGISLIAKEDSAAIVKDDANGPYAGITIRANNVKVEGFTVSGFFAGILAQDSSGAELQKNLTLHGTHGIQLLNARNVSAKQNTSTLCFNGVEVSQSSQVTLEHNVFCKNENSGISVVRSYACSVLHNEASENYNGIYILHYSDVPGETQDQHMTVAHNRCSGNIASGITVDHSCAGTFSFNVAKGNGTDFFSTDTSEAPCGSYEHNVGKTGMPSLDFWR